MKLFVKFNISNILNCTCQFTWKSVGRLKKKGKLLFRKQLVLTTCLVATINFNFTMIVYCAIYCWLFLFKTSNYFLCTIYISHLLLLTQRCIYDLQDEKILAVHWILILLWNGPISHVSGLNMAIHYFMPYSCICKLWWRWCSYIHITIPK